MGCLCGRSRVLTTIRRAPMPVELSFQSHSARIPHYIGKEKPACYYYYANWSILSKPIGDLGIHLKEPCVTSDGTERPDRANDQQPNELANGTHEGYKHPADFRRKIA